MFWFDNSQSNTWGRFSWPLKKPIYGYEIHPTGVSSRTCHFDDPIWVHGYKCAARLQALLYTPNGAMRPSNNPMLKRWHNNFEVFRFRLEEGIVDRNGKEIPEAKNLKGKTIVLIDTWYTRMHPEDGQVVCHYVDYHTYKEDVEAARNDALNAIQDAVESSVKSAFRDELKKAQAKAKKLQFVSSAENVIELMAHPNPIDPKDVKNPCVYLLYSGGRYKIGYSDNLSSRLTQMSTGTPFEINVVCAIECDDPRQLERELHRKFHEKRVHREWFTLTDDDVRYIHALAEAA
jgi:hypothetical protein